MTNVNFIIDDYRQEDYAQVELIYQQGIDSRLATFETEVKPRECWENTYVSGSKIVVRQGRSILGWAGLSLVSRRSCYSGVAEVTVYVANDAKGQGVGKSLLQALITRSEQLGFWTLQATIFKRNPASIAVHQKCGFRIVGEREKVAKLDGKWLNTVLTERRSQRVGV